jgi:hypothetical protein
MLIFGLKSLHKLLKLYKIGYTQKNFEFHVIKLLVLHVYITLALFSMFIS